MIEHLDKLVRDYEVGRLSRRALLVQLGAMLTVAGLGRRAMAGGDEEPTFRAVGLNHIALNVTDVPKSRDFYRRHLGLTVQSDGQQSCFLGCGDDFLALFKAEQPSMDHYCYSIRGYDPDNAVERLKAAGLSPRRAGDRVYFDDPDGLEVQVAEGSR